MEKSKINDENYIQIQGWMIKELKLKGNELLIYAIIYGFSQDGISQYKAGLQYLADWTNSTKQGCIKNLKNLIEKELIIKDEKEINNIKYCNYYVDIQKVNTGKQSLIPGKQSLIPGKQSLTNNIYNNIENNKKNKSISKDIDTPESKEPKINEELFLKENTKCIIEYLNETAGTKYRTNTKQTLKLIKARFKEGYVLDDFYDVIDNKWKDWKNTEWEKYMRPETLFGNKFENYLNQKSVFKGKVKTSYGSKPSFDNTSEHNIPKEPLNKKERQKLIQDNLVKDSDGNFIKF